METLVCLQITRTKDSGRNTNKRNAAQSELCLCSSQYLQTESEFNEFEPHLKSTKNRFQLSAGLNLEIFHTILSGTKI